MRRHRCFCHRARQSTEISGNTATRGIERARQRRRRRRFLGTVSDTLPGPQTVLYEMAESGVVDRVEATVTNGQGRPPSRVEPRFPPTAFRRLYDFSRSPTVRGRSTLVIRAVTGRLCRQSCGRRAPRPSTRANRSRSRLRCSFERDHRTRSQRYQLRTFWGC